MSFLKSIKDFFQEKSRVSACAKHDFYKELLLEAINAINKNANLQEDEIEFYKKVGEYCISHHLSLDKERDIIEAIVMNSFNVPIVGIYYLDGWFQSARYDQDRFTSDYITIYQRFANQILHTRNARKGEYIVVIEEKPLELKKQIRDFQGRILREAVIAIDYYARLIKITDDHEEDNAKISHDFNQRAHKYAIKNSPPIILNKPSQEAMEQYNLARQTYIQRYGDGREYFNNDVKGIVIERKYIKTLENLSFIHSKILQQEQVYNVGDIAYTSSNRKVKVLEKTEKGYLVKDLFNGLVGDETRLYDVISAYFTEYFSHNKITATLKWKKDKERGVK